MFERTRRAHPASLLLPAALVAGLGWVLAHRQPDLALLRPVVEATRGLVTVQFLLSLAAFGLVIGIMLLAGRIKPDDAGLQRDLLGRGVGATAMIWGASQVIGVLPRVVANRPVLLDPAFEHGSRWDLGGHFLTALATGSLEELVFRGLLLVQLYRLFNREHRDEDVGTLPAAAITLLVAGLAALPGVWPYASIEAAAIGQGILLGGGAFLCWLYFRTKNLFFVIGIHALLLAPSPVVAGPRGGGQWYHPLVVAILATLWALLWPRRD